jgi:hypothetical protein
MLRLGSETNETTRDAKVFAQLIETGAMTPEDAEQAAIALREKDWHRFVYLRDRPWRPYSLWSIADRIDDQVYWDLTRDVWIDSENIWQNRLVWHQLLLTKRPGSFMSEENRAEFEKLPDPVTVYRGYVKGKNFSGYSWTTNKEKAWWFAKRFPYLGTPQVRRATLSKNGIFAYINDRDEQEVIALRHKTQGAAAPVR